MSESSFETTTRQGIEKRIVEAFNAHDINQVNAQLDIYPGGLPRNEVTLETAHHIASQCSPVRKVIPFSNYREAA